MKNYGGGNTPPPLANPLVYQLDSNRRTVEFIFYDSSDHINRSAVKINAEA